MSELFLSYNGVPLADTEVTESTAVTVEPRIIEGVHDFEPIDIVGLGIVSALALAVASLAVVNLRTNQRDENIHEDSLR